MWLATGEMSAVRAGQPRAAGGRFLGELVARKLTRVRKATTSRGASGSATPAGKGKRRDGYRAPFWRFLFDFFLQDGW